MRSSGTKRDVDSRGDDADDDVSDDAVYLMIGTYMNNLDSVDEEEGNGDGEPRGCLPRFRTWIAGVLHPGRHQRVGLVWYGFRDFHYSVLH